MHPTKFPSVSTNLSWYQVRDFKVCWKRASNTRSSMPLFMELKSDAEKIEPNITCPCAFRGHSQAMFTRWGRYRISSYNFRGNYSFLNLEIQRAQYIRPKVTVHKYVETIQGRKLFKGGNYKRKYGNHFILLSCLSMLCSPVANFVHQSLSNLLNFSIEI